jgi:hypothetical protein
MFRIILRSNSNSTSPHIPCPHIPARFDVFHPATLAEVSKPISDSSDTWSYSFFSAQTVYRPTSVFLPNITAIINLFLACGVLPDKFRSSSVHSFLKKSNCDEKELSNYRTISYLSFFKLIERVVKFHLSVFIRTQSSQLIAVCLYQTPFSIRCSFWFTWISHALRLMSGWENATEGDACNRL